mmetsp:Transcript_99136/g.251739  ORF Transcript_99136/g.251739 Transcript_99136/m.251739 type:complete len:424 (+) Transcript_99136:726-1997(+)
MAVYLGRQAWWQGGLRVPVQAHVLVTLREADRVVALRINRSTLVVFAVLPHPHELPRWHVCTLEDAFLRLSEDQLVQFAAGGLLGHGHQHGQTVEVTPVLRLFPVVDDDATRRALALGGLVIINAGITLVLPLRRVFILDLAQQQKVVGANAVEAVGILEEFVELLVVDLHKDAALLTEARDVCHNNSDELLDGLLLVQLHRHLQHRIRPLFGAARADDCHGEGGQGLGLRRRKRDLPREEGVKGHRYAATSLGLWTLHHRLVEPNEDVVDFRIVPHAVAFEGLGRRDFVISPFGLLCLQVRFLLHTVGVLLQSIHDVFEELHGVLLPIAAELLCELTDLPLEVAGCDFGGVPSPHLLHELRIALGQLAFRLVGVGVQALVVFVREEELAQSGHIGQTLQRAVHKTRVAEVLQADDAAQRRRI